MKETIFDPLRRKYVVLTPEEAVRQHFIKWLNKERNYPLTLMASEYSIKYNKMNYRCDIVTFNKLLEPQLIVECKASNVKLTQETIEQIIRYNLVLKVKNLIITNGVSTFACKLNPTNGQYEFVEDIPYYEK
ncbi:MAG: type I restriction enzyme HsdR N-terminal domain-containing protein [Bacteroidales bacterium]